MVRLQPDVREMESQEWSQPLLSIAAGDAESSKPKD
jgi:hypothetical protein